MKTKFPPKTGRFLLLSSLTFSMATALTAEVTKKNYNVLISCSQTDEYKTYRTEQEKKITANEKQIADLRAKKENVVKEDREKYEKKIDALEQKNNDLKSKIKSNYMSEGKDKWESFKREYNHDMDELGKSLKDLAKNNVK